MDFSLELLPTQAKFSVISVVAVVEKLILWMVERVNYVLGTAKLTETLVKPKRDAYSDILSYLDCQAALAALMPSWLSQHARTSS